jgi:3-hydroxy-9,10-secoandrosta-1,3,5(10)-triene-9,17-dione monooxygenase reductase component
MASPVSTSSDVDPRRLRDVMARFATGVVVITANTPDGPTGMAVNSFTSVSLDPPLVLFCAGKSSTTWPSIEDAGAFSVNVLGQDAEAICGQFASNDGERFAGVEFRSGATGAPVLDEAIAHLDCTIHEVHDAGDHVIVVGHVHDLDAPDGDPLPLIFFRGSYARLGA